MCLLVLLWSLPLFAAPSSRAVGKPADRTGKPTSHNGSSPARASARRTPPPGDAQLRRKAATPPSFRLPPRRAFPPQARLPRVGFSASFWAQTLGMVFALAVVVLSIFVVLRWVSSKMQTIQGMQGRLLSVTSRVALEPKKGLWIVEAAGSYYLLATHDQGVTVLDKLDTPSVRAVLEGDEPPAQPFWKAFATKSDKTSTEAALSTAAIPTSFEIISDGKSTSSPTDTENNDAQDSSNS